MEKNERQWMQLNTEPDGNEYIQMGFAYHQQFSFWIHERRGTKKNIGNEFGWTHKHSSCTILIY